MNATVIEKRTQWACFLKIRVCILVLQFGLSEKHTKRKKTWNHFYTTLTTVHCVLFFTTVAFICHFVLLIESVGIVHLGCAWWDTRGGFSIKIEKMSDVSHFLCDTWVDYTAWWACISYSPQCVLKWCFNLRSW